MYKSGVFGKQQTNVLNDISFSVSPGEIFGVTGHSGCGKSTLAKILVNLVSPDGGSVKVDGEDATRIKTRTFKTTKRPIGIVFQNPDDSLDPSYTLGSSLSQAFLYNDRSDAEGFDLDVLSEYLAVPLDLLDRYPNQVSGGEIQRIAMACAFSLNPKYMVLDEPTSMLDVSTQAHILRSIQKIAKEREIGIILISHNLFIIKELCDRAVVIKGGIVAERISKADAWNSDPAGEFQRLMNEML